MPRQEQKEPPPPPSVAKAIAEAQALTKAGKFAEAIAVLEARQKELGATITGDEKRALLVTMADVNVEWAEHAEKRSDWKEAIVRFQAAYEIDKNYRKLNTANEFNKIGGAYNSLGDKTNALFFYNQSLLIYRHLGVKTGEAIVLISIGSTYSSLSEKTKAKDFYVLALPILRQLKEKEDEVYILGNIGNIYYELCQFSKALEYYNLALPIFREIGEKTDEAVTLNTIGNLYSDLGEKVKALEFYNHALTIYKKVGDKRGEAATLNNIGKIYNDLDEKIKALEYLNQALPLSRQVGYKGGEAYTLNNIGGVYDNVGEKPKALEFYNQALTIYKEIEHKRGEARTLHNIGKVYADVGEKTKALQSYNQALTLSRQVGDRQGEATTLNNLMWVWQDKTVSQHSLGVAVMYGKRSVNLYQVLREDAKKIGQQELTSFTKSVETTYRQLSEILLTQGRLTEAEQVLGLLKQQEFFGFVRSGNEYAKILELAELTPREKRAYDEYEKNSEVLVKLSQEKEALEKQGKLAPLTDAQKAELAGLEQKIEAANTVFVTFLTKGLPALFPKNAPPEDPSSTLKLVRNRKFTTTLKKLRQSTKQKPVAIYSLVGEERLSLIVNTGAVPVVRQLPVTAKQINETVLAFRTALKNPKLDPRPVGKKLYDWLIKPIEKDLMDAKATRLMWSQDGTLRYIPVGALWDGKQYLIERFGGSLFTIESLDSLKDGNTPQPRLAGMGVSTGGAGFAELPGAKRELEALVKVGAGGKGLYPGTLLLNERFSKEAFKSTLAQHYPLVHIASHFSIHPGDNEASFLLLGGGQKLSIADLQALGPIFEGVDLLTLSACETAVSGKAGEPDKNGAEVESIAMAAEQAGARAILASLWEVADDSTRLLMENFHRARTVLQLDKAEALRAAQLSLLRNKAVAIPGSGRGLTPAQSTRPSAIATFTHDPKTPYAHPYYWAPFILTGNWR